MTYLYNRPDIVNKIKKKLELAGHIWRKPEALIKRVLQENPRGKRPLGRS